MNRQHQEVQIWLEKIFGDQSVPSYELNQFTVSVLYNLMHRNEQKEKDCQLLIEDLRQKAEEYNVESRRIENILQCINLTAASLSQSGLMSLRTLANLALSLQTKDASDTSFLLALQHLEDEIRRTEESRRAQQKILNSLVQKTKTAVLKYSALKKALEDLERKSVEEQPEMEKHARDTQFIRVKAKEYKSQVQKLEGVLEKSGADPSIYHGSLVQRAEDFEKLKQEIVPMKKKLDSYNGLPPDAIQAHMRLDEIKDKVAHLEEELTKKIDVMLV
ncbi:HAUS augmin-like complex subunit 1 [Mercenaria mercenaria]|uniref:HAUS augmin-like complex subunit 1 n=1 Tax=Mercenaria mercenaria TaxID=6596 RepID=UPI00234F11AA|nr:HAUS augmin-like complex subunit 1 [Mercenaria mercenaria]